MTTASRRPMLGRRTDWIRKPSFHPSLRGLPGPLVVAATVAISWLPFTRVPTDAGSDPLGLYLGTVAILLMAWSFVLALRLRPVESLFGGLDRGYAWHRWLGVLSLLTMWLHIQQPNLVRAIPGASPSLAEVGTSLAGLAEIVFYVLIALSVIRLFPYRWWRLTHKLLGIPYLISCFHFITAEKPWANFSPWGAWFGVIMAAGALAWVGRVIVRDVVRPGIPYLVSAVRQSPAVTEVILRPAGGRRMTRRLGQFAFVKVQAAGLTEPHPFSIASAPDAEHLRFLMRVRGDWTDEANSAIEVGQTVLVEGPYGRLRLFPPSLSGRATVWFAGGLGITAFLSAIAAPRDPSLPPPDLFYSVSTREAAMGLADLTAAADKGRIELHLHVSDEHGRLTREDIETVVGPAGLVGAHVVICGPDGYAVATQKWASALGARRIERESFDLRSGIGPDPSTTRLTAHPWLGWLRPRQRSTTWFSPTNRR